MAMSERAHTSGTEDDLYDAALARLYREAGREEPPPLDERILAAARREAGAGPRGARAPGKQRS